MHRVRTIHVEGRTVAEGWNAVSNILPTYTRTRGCHQGSYAALEHREEAMASLHATLADTAADRRGYASRRVTLAAPTPSRDGVL